MNNIPINNIPLAALQEQTEGLEWIAIQQHTVPADVRRDFRTSLQQLLKMNPAIQGSTILIDCRLVIGCVQDVDQAYYKLTFMYPALHERRTNPCLFRNYVLPANFSMRP